VSDPIIDDRGWRDFDDVKPANMEIVLIWNEDAEDCQFAKFMMYGPHRYEFTQGSNGDVSPWRTEG
jgi:hypothetical protein